MISSLNCLGCQACSDLCPSSAITFVYDAWGDGKAKVNMDLCVNCGKCDKICPKLIAELNERQEKVYAVISKANHKTGSSGGVFYDLASKFINKGGIVFGAAFDKNLKLIHQKSVKIKELYPLCKSKYIHSDMRGIYREIGELLKADNSIMFVGTPCQVSAVKNLFGDKYRDKLLLVDFLCRGTGTQKLFDLCIKAEENKRGGKIKEFYFRAKSRNAEHSFVYNIEKNNRIKTVSGYAFEFPYYYSFLKYTIFNDACYSCNYAQNSRVGDTPLGDFWHIQNYNSSLKDKNGVSMVSLNTDKGYKLFEEIKDVCSVYEYPLEYASKYNESFNKCVDLLEDKKNLASILYNQGESDLLKSLECPNLKKELIYAKTPLIIKKIYNEMRGRK